MARPIRIDIADGWYHTMSRGFERRAVFRDVRDCEHFERVIQVVAAEKKEPWERFRDRHGDCGRDVALWLGRHHCGLTLAELGAAAGAMSYPAVGHAVRKIEHRRQTDRHLATLLKRLEAQCVSIDSAEKPSRQAAARRCLPRLNRAFPARTRGDWRASGACAFASLVIVPCASPFRF